MKYTIPCLFGLEALVADELRRLDLKNVRAENGRVHCDGVHEEFRSNITAPS